MAAQRAEVADFCRFCGAASSIRDRQYRVLRVSAYATYFTVNWNRPGDRSVLHGMAGRTIPAATLLLVLLLAACGSANEQLVPIAPTSQGSSTESPATTQSPTTSASALSQTTLQTPAATQPTTATFPTVGLAPGWEIQVPADWTITSVVGTDPFVALAYRPSPDSDLGSQVLWRVGSDPSSASDVSELLPEHNFAAVQKLVRFDGRFFAFATGQRDETESGTSTGPAQYLVSADGIEWSISALDAGPLNNVARARFTPDAPPYPDTSAVLDATVYNETMYATGWDLVDGQVAIIVWSTTDGERWNARRIPHRFFETEYGAKIVVGDAGVIVRVGGPVHTGVEALLSVEPDRFFSIDDALNLDQSFIGDASQGGFGLAVVEYGLNYDDDQTVMWVTTDGATWSPSTIPLAVASEHTPNYRLVQSTATPTVYTETWDDNSITVLHQQADEWIELGVLGQRVVDHNGRLLTWEPGLLRLYALS